MKIESKKAIVIFTNFFDANDKTKLNTYLG